MGRQSFSLEQLEDGLPLFYHQNALSYIFENNSNFSFPTQLVYPDTSISIGLNANPQKSILLIEDNYNVEEGEHNQEVNGILLIYASQSSNEIIKHKLYPYYFKFLILTLIQTLFLIALTIVVKSKIYKEFVFWFLVLYDIPLSYTIFHKQILQTLILRLIHISLVLIVLFLSLTSIYDIIFMSIFLIKSSITEKMLTLIMPHIFTISGDI